jgi:hypothetical protein
VGHLLDRPLPPGQRGKRARQLKTQGGQQITLARSYGLCPTCKKGLFPPR